MSTRARSIRVDKVREQQAQQVFDELGITLSGAVNMFLAQVAIQKRIPFVLDANPTSDDDFRVNMAHPNVIKRNPSQKFPVLPAEWDDDSDDVYGDLYATKAPL